MSSWPASPLRCLQRLLNAVYGEMMRQPGDREKATDYGDKSGPGGRSEKLAPDLNDAAAPRRLLTQYGPQQMAMYEMVMKDWRQWWKSQQRLMQCFAEARRRHLMWPEISGSKARSKHQMHRARSTSKSKLSKVNWASRILSRSGLRHHMQPDMPGQWEPSDK